MGVPTHPPWWVLGLSSFYPTPLGHGTFPSLFHPNGCTFPIVPRPTSSYTYPQEVCHLRLSPSLDSPDPNRYGIGGPECLGTQNGDYTHPRPLVRRDASSVSPVQSYRGGTSRPTHRSSLVHLWVPTTEFVLV